MLPPADVPSAPSKSATSSSAIPCAAIAERSSTVRRPGSPEAVVAFGSGSPSVCATSYLEIRQPSHGNAALVVGGDTCMAKFQVPVTTRFEQDCRVCSKTLTGSGSRTPLVNPCGVYRELCVQLGRGVANCPDHSWHRRSSATTYARRLDSAYIIAIKARATPVSIRSMLVRHDHRISRRSATCGFGEPRHARL
jgi:hypothetical protein